MSVDPELKIFPFLVVNDASRAVDFYIKAFGAVEQDRYTNLDKTVSRISIGKAEFKASWKMIDVLGVHSGRAS